MRSVRNQGRHPYRRAVAIWYWIDHGGRTDLAQAAEAIRSGMDIREVALEFPEPFIKYHKGMMAYKSLITSRGPRKCPRRTKCGSSGEPPAPASPVAPSRHGRMPTAR